MILLQLLFNPASDSADGFQFASLVWFLPKYADFLMLLCPAWWDTRGAVSFHLGSVYMNAKYYVVCIHLFVRPSKHSVPKHFCQNISVTKKSVSFQPFYPLLPPKPYLLYFSVSVDYRNWFGLKWKDVYICCLSSLCCDDGDVHPVWGFLHVPVHILLSSLVQCLSIPSYIWFCFFVHCDERPNLISSIWVLHLFCRLTPSCVNAQIYEQGDMQQ